MLDLIATAELAEHLDDPAWVVLDCRFSLADPAAGSRQYSQAHIPGARYVHLDEDLSAPVSAASGRHPLPGVAGLVTKLGRWGIDSTTRVVAYDDAGGAIAARLWWLLRWLGHEAVAVLDGGFPEWGKACLPVTEIQPEVAPRDFLPVPGSMPWLATPAVEMGQSNGSIQLLDARTGERFRGEVEPIDPRAGHIPGARNHPLEDNLLASGAFRSPGELRQRFAAILEDVPAERVVHMCGSGVTACHNLLAMEIAGLTGSALYAGSWSEWIRDPSHPIATGA